MKQYIILVSEPEIKKVELTQEYALDPVKACIDLTGNEYDPNDAIFGNLLNIDIMVFWDGISQGGISTLRAYGKFSDTDISCPCVIYLDSGVGPAQGFTEEDADALVSELTHDRMFYLHDLKY